MQEEKEFWILLKMERGSLLSRRKGIGSLNAPRNVAISFAIHPNINPDKNARHTSWHSDYWAKICMCFEAIGVRKRYRQIVTVRNWLLGMLIQFRLSG